MNWTDLHYRYDDQWTPAGNIIVADRIHQRPYQKAPFAGS
jgi:hypothetical protein